MHNKPPEFVSASFIAKKYSITAATLRNWADNGTIQCLRPEGGTGRRLYNLQSVKNAIGDKETQSVTRESIIYARVSSVQQQSDLERQKCDLQTAFPHHRLISDVGSGLNFKRKGLQALLERVVKGMVEEVVVMHKDRLCRFGIDLVMFLFESFGTKLVVHGREVSEGCHQELADDLLAVTTVFVARNNGLRSAQNRKRRKIEATEQPPIPTEEGGEMEGEDL